MKTTVTSVTRNGDVFVVHAQFELSAIEFSVQEVEQIVKDFQAPKPSAKMKAIELSPTQAKVNKMMGVEPQLFAKYYPNG